MLVQIQAKIFQNPPTKKKKNHTSYLKNRKQLDFIISHTSEDEILKIIHRLNDNKSTGPSSTPIKLLKLSAPYIVIPLCKIINSSLSNGIFRDKVKIAKVIPTHKQ